MIASWRRHPRGGECCNTGLPPLACRVGQRRRGAHLTKAVRNRVRVVLVQALERLRLNQPEKVGDVLALLPAFHLRPPALHRCRRFRHHTCQAQPIPSAPCSDAAASAIAAGQRATHPSSSLIVRRCAKVGQPAQTHLFQHNPEHPPLRNLHIHTTPLRPLHSVAQSRVYTGTTRDGAGHRPSWVQTRVELSQF